MLIAQKESCNGDIILNYKYYISIISSSNSLVITCITIKNASKISQMYSCNVSMFVRECKWKRVTRMDPSLSLLSCELPLSFKEIPNKR